MNGYPQDSPNPAFASAKPVHEIDRQVWQWMKRVYLFVLLALGLLAVAILIFAATRPGAMQKEIDKLAKSPTAASATCHVCGKPAFGYWYPLWKPDYHVHFCSVHKSSARGRAESVVAWPRLVLVLVLVALGAPYMMYKYWPRLSCISQSIDSDSASFTTTWFWMLAATSIIFHVIALPANLFIALKAKKAYRSCPKRLRLCSIAAVVATWPLAVFACLFAIRLVLGIGR